MALISLAEYAEKHGRHPDTVRQLALRGKFETARKIGRNWVIEEDEPYTDNRVTSGKYVGTGKNANASTLSHSEDKDD